MRTFISLAWWVLVAPWAHAGSQDAQLSPTYAPCMSKATATSELMACIQAEFLIQDRRLNEHYKNLMGRLEEDRRKQLQETQRLWLKYIEANCSFYHPPHGGSAHRVMAADCAVQERARRATELADLVKME